MLACDPLRSFASNALRFQLRRLDQNAGIVSGAVFLPLGLTVTTIGNLIGAILGLKAQQAERLSS